MKPSSQIWAKLFLIGATIGIITSVIWNQNALAKFTTQNKILPSVREEIKRLERENQEIPRLRVLNEEAEQLQAGNRDLPRMRNEIHQLREQTKALKMLRLENERLRTLREASPATAASSVLPSDFLPKSVLRDVGLETPEAALQTAFWAMCQGDLIRWSQCLVDGADRLQEDKDWQRKQLVEEMKHFIGFRIARKKVVSPSEVELGLQSSVGGTILPMTLKQVGTEWKLDN